MMNDEYRTLLEAAEGMYKEKGSKFLAFAMPVQSVEEVKKQLDNLRRQYHDARHHCYAYRLGESPFEWRHHDDGEPSGTAGKPILGQIQSFDLTNILVVVIRYFGGVKLGTGGLIQAYRAAARDAITQGIVITKNWKINLRICFKYPQINEVMRIIKEENARIIKQESEDNYVITLEIRKGRIAELENKFKTLETVEWFVI